MLSQANTGIEEISETYLDRNGTALSRFKMNQASVLEAGLKETSGICAMESPPAATLATNIELDLDFLTPVGATDSS
jgi:hypothetical protein